ncbi:unnamed protein product [Notodromas monacha]|uniref:MARVEL domain-containing protein n=1 Tax=Notodromas monacha TaxID=399045 RepID=A0A7R9GF40_9CRUS|nr:unnamed protein product [Notodromas monacha]CAG0918937.1 unnamed protein product [Notodromas monacha]
MGILNSVYGLIAGPENMFFFILTGSSWHTSEVLTLVTWFALAANLVFLLICCLMIHGVRLEKRCLLLPWIVWSCLYILFLIFSVVIIFLAGTGDLRLLALAVGLIFFVGAWAYFTLVVVAFFQALRGGYALDQPTLPVWNQKDHY